MNGRSIAIYGKTIQDEFFPYLEKMLCRIKAEGIALDCEVGFAAFWRNISVAGIGTANCTGSLIFRGKIRLCC